MTHKSILILENKNAMKLSFFISRIKNSRDWVIISMKQWPFRYSKLYLIIAQDHNITLLERPVAKMLTALFANL